MKDKSSQSGQVLLILVLVATVLVTVALSVSRVTTEEQKVSKLEEDSKRAFAAAEAGLEAALKQGDINDLSTLGLGGGITGSAKLSANPATTFNSPLVKKDDMLTFYLSDYDPVAETITGGPYSGSMTVDKVTPSGDYCLTSSTQFLVELTFVDTVNKKIATRKVIDECGLIESNTDKVVFGETINLSTTPASLLVLRVISISPSFAGATFTLTNISGNWPLQGRTIVSQAKTQTGAAEKIQLYQSHPQIPTEFWVTSF